MTDRPTSPTISTVRLELFSHSFSPTSSNALAIEGKTFSRESAAHDVASKTVDQNFRQVMEIPLLRGREFDTRDRGNTEPVAIINQALADQYFPNQESTGHPVNTEPPGDPMPWPILVGIVGNVKTST